MAEDDNSRHGGRHDAPVSTSDGPTITSETANGIGPTGETPESEAERWFDLLQHGMTVDEMAAVDTLLEKQRLDSKKGVKRKPDLTIEQILAWADEHFTRTGRWPLGDSGLVEGVPHQTWTGVNLALRKGSRGLPGGSSLNQLLAAERGKRNPRDLPSVTEEEIAIWADRFHASTGSWPTADSGPVEGVPGQTWSAVEGALRAGARGLPGGSSLAQLLAGRHGVRNRMALPSLRIDEILDWADAHFRETGTWPNKKSGPVRCIAMGSGPRSAAAGDDPLAPVVPVDTSWPLREVAATADSAEDGSNAYLAMGAGETWSGIDTALSKGTRGLPGGSSLPQLLAEHRRHRNRKALPHHTYEQILAWADAHYARTGEWPTSASGPVHDAPGESWAGVDLSLRNGLRGLPGGTSLPQLLAATRGKRNSQALAALSAPEIFTWAQEHHVRTGVWPIKKSGPVAASPGETWSGLDAALICGSRTLPGGSSLARLLASMGSKRNRSALPRLTVEQILAWADEHFRHTGEWPTVSSGELASVGCPASAGERWRAIDGALKQGCRGLPGGSSLARLLAERHGVRNSSALPHLTPEQILAWADAHHERTGQWPNCNSGPVSDAPLEWWSAIDRSLINGRRGLPGGSSLPRLLAVARGKRNKKALPALTVAQIAAWAEDHYARFGVPPGTASGPVAGNSAENWRAIDSALRQGNRGLPAGLSLARLWRARNKA